VASGSRCERAAGRQQGEVGVTILRVVLTRHVLSEVAVSVEADSTAEAERLALVLAPEIDADRAWTEVNREVSASVEET
jgi:hypothetical protein